MDDRPRSAQSSGGNGVSTRVQRTTVSERPEKKLVKFAMVLVILQRISTGIGALGFFWATTIVLVNLASMSNKTDFYLITIILLMETARNFSMGRDLERSPESAWTISDALKGLANKVISVCKSGDLEAGKSPKTGGDTRTLNQEDPQLLRPDADDLSILSSNLRKVLYCLQLLSALACITLSVGRVVQLSLGAPIDPTSSDDDTNLKATVYVFYVMAIVQASLSLAEKAYWEWEITELLDEVNRECNELGMIPITSFFYHAYLERVNGNIFDGLSQQLDWFSFASNLLNTHSKKQQLIGIEILQKNSSDRRYSDDTLRNISTSMPVMQKLLYMLSWKNSKDAKTRRTAAEIVVKLAGRSWKSFNVSGFPGALEDISALLDPASDDNNIELEQNCFAILGMKILKKLSNNHDNCEEIAHTRRLLLKLLDRLEDPVFRNHSAKILDNLCKKAGKYFLENITGVVAVASKVLRALMRSEENEQPEQLLALTTKLFSFMTSEEAALVFKQTESLMIHDVTIRLKEILSKNKAILEQPNCMSAKELDKVRRTTCNAIILATETMLKIEDAVSTFRIHRMEKKLLQIQEATRSNMDCEFIHKHVEMALELLAEG